MVQVADNHFVDFSISGDPSDWLAKLPIKYSIEQQQLIAKAFELARLLISENEALQSEFKEGLIIANVLIQLHVDAATLASAIVYPFFQSELVDATIIEARVSPEVAKLCQGVHAMDALQALQNEFKIQNDAGQQKESFRKMLLAMVDDVRLVLIKLAERLSVLRQAKFSDVETQKVIAKEVSEVYAPLANRLGIGQFKWEMEDLVFRYLHGNDYKSIAKNLAERRLDREKYVKQVIDTIVSQLKELQIENAEVMGRAKHIYSIWKKMVRKNVGFEEIYDVRAVRVLVETVPQCYAALGIVHGLWNHIPKEFDDYIATPKENGYRSLHTAVIGPGGKTLEIQIRTFSMHQESELGVAAHWRYKEGAKPQESGFEAKISWLRQLLEWQEDLADNNELIDEFKNEVTEDRVYVFTPQGKVVDLPLGSTPVDFAYHVHTDVGHNCRGAKIGGKIVPLNYALKTGEQVQILTSKNSGPSRDWLHQNNGYVKSSRARSKIHQWFRHQDKDKNTIAGKSILEKELARHGFEKIDLESVANHFNLHNSDDLFASVGAGDLGLNQILNSIRAQQQKDQLTKAEKQVFKPIKTTKKKQPKGIQIEGVGSLLTKIAGCCKPVPGDDILGYITQGRGVVVHREDCNHILKARDERAERLIKVSWGDSSQDVFDVDIAITAFDRKGLLKDITTVLANEKVSVEAMNSHIDKRKQHSIMKLRLNVDGVEKLDRVIAQLSQVPNVFEVKRYQ